MATSNNNTVLLLGVVIIVAFLTIFFFSKRRPEVVVVERTDPCCPPCGRGILFFDYMEDMLSGDARLYHEFMQLKGLWDCDGPSKPFIDKKTRAKLQSLVIPNRIRVTRVDSGECMCMRVGLKDRRTYLETPDGERRYQVILRDKNGEADCLQSIMDPSVTFSLVDETNGRNVDAKLDINVDDFTKLRDALDQLHQLLEDFVRNTFV